MKRRTFVIALLAAVVVIMSGLLIFDRTVGKFMPLTAAQKAAVVEGYKLAIWGGEKYDPDGEFYRKMPLVWFDENGGKRDNRVFRFFGTYGDCIVLLRYGDNQTGLMTPVKLPCPLYGLSRDVYYPMECDIYLYHTKPNYPKHDMLGAPLASLYDLEYHKLKWLTDTQLEQLTNDLECWVAEGNY